MQFFLLKTFMLKDFCLSYVTKISNQLEFQDINLERIFGLRNFNSPPKT